MEKKQAVHRKISISWTEEKGWTPVIIVRPDISTLSRLKYQKTAAICFKRGFNTNTSRF